MRDKTVREHKLDLRPDEITEKNTNKGYNRTLKYSNGLNYSFTAYSYMGILVDMSGYSAKISYRVGLIGK